MSPTRERSPFSVLSRPALLVLMLLLIAGVFAWYTLLCDRQTPLEAEYAALNRRDLTDPVKTSGLSVISLVPAAFQDTASTARHAASGLTNSVVFRLALPFTETEGSELEASIERSGTPVFSVPGRVFRNAFGSELRFMAPKGILQPGNYEVTVSPSGAGITKVTYQLRIE